MKKTIILLLLSFYGWAQHRNEGKITYSTFLNESRATEELKKESLWQYQYELNKLEMAKNFEFELHFKDNYSCFKIKEKMIGDHIDKDDYTMMSWQFYGEIVYFTNKNKGVCYEIGYFNTEDELLINHYSEDFTWELSNETKLISGYKCYKATTEWRFNARGKDQKYKVVAWYCPEIPISFCPNKYPDLPGLVLELSETSRTWIVNKIELNTKSALDETQIAKLEKAVKRSK